MNKIVREHYPAAKLPEDLRVGLDLDAAVTVTIVEEGRGGARRTAGQDRPITQILEEMQEHRTRAEDPVIRVRALRAEWERREELHDRIRAGDRP